jgi:bifunctional DNA-binding transcriptional regulator/antitoxin component of YhaV-PrlF toxin-antitoxin module
MDITLSEQGQLTLSESFLEHLGVNPGEPVSINKMPDGKLEIVASANKMLDGESEIVTKKKWTVAQAEEYFQSIFVDNKIHATIEEINEAIAAGYAKAGMSGLMDEATVEELIRLNKINP